jgi:hypothetical protein
VRTDAGIRVDDELHLLPLVAAVDLPVTGLLRLPDSDRPLLPPSCRADPLRRAAAGRLDWTRLGREDRRWWRRQ